MSNFGDFKVLDRTRMNLPPKIFGGGPWTHYGTVIRGLREYIVLLHVPSHKIYIEEITATGNFLKIDDDSLWRDLVLFCTKQGLTGESVGKEIVVSR